jgi:hypothetical protein
VADKTFTHYLEDCPYPIEEIRNAIGDNDRLASSRTPRTLIWFGEDVRLATGVEMDLTPGLKVADGKNLQHVFMHSFCFKSGVGINRVPNLRSSRGEVEASPVWVVMHSSIASVKLLQATCQGAVDKICIYNVSYYNTGGEKDQPTVTSSSFFESCFITFVDLSTVENVAIFRFSFARVTVSVSDFEQYSVSGINKNCGTYVYCFDFNAASGKVVPNT